MPISAMQNVTCLLMAVMLQNFFLQKMQPCISALANWLLVASVTALKDLALKDLEELAAPVQVSLRRHAYEPFLLSALCTGERPDEASHGDRR